MQCTMLVHACYWELSVINLDAVQIESLRLECPLRVNQPIRLDPSFLSYNLVNSTGYEPKRA
jgi:hypothetical protein